MRAQRVGGPVAVPQQIEITMAMLSKAANAGAYCPTNRDIADAVGAQSINTSARIMAILKASEVITVQRYNDRRVVTITETGKSTAQPDRTVSHWRDGGARKNPPRKKAARHIAALSAAEILPPVVDRDPCPRCGVRADIGCTHARGALGMGAFA